MVGARSSKGLAGEGPEGNVSEVNRVQLKWMPEGLKLIEAELTLFGHPELVRSVNPSALQELVCELFFTDMVGMG